MTEVSTFDFRPCSNFSPDPYEPRLCAVCSYHVQNHPSPVMGEHSDGSQ